MKKRINSYDEIKGLLNKVRYIQSNYKIIKEQQESSEDSDIDIVNGVEITIHSVDTMDLELSEDEKGKISQLIDDFRSEVSEIGDFGKLQIYPNSCKLDGTITGIDLNFTFSTGDDNGVYISTNLLKIDDTSFMLIDNLKKFEEKFTSTLNEILSMRKGN